MTRQTTHEDHRHEALSGSRASAGVHLLREGPPSPRAALAFSALSSVTWLREKAVGLLGRIKFWRTTVARTTKSCKKAVVGPRTEEVIAFPTKSNPLDLGDRLPNYAPLDPGEGRMSN
jgi:hypothetical protein